MSDDSAQIICFGEMLWDNFPGGRVPGGGPMNVAVHARRFGMRSALVSRIGADEAGRELMGFLIAQGVSNRFTQTDPILGTGHVDVIQGGAEEVRYDIASPVAWDKIELTEEVVGAVRQADMFVFGTLAARSERSRETLFALLSHARLKICDLNFRPPHYNMALADRLLHEADILKLNEGEFMELLPHYGRSASDRVEGMDFIRRTFCLDTVIITLGSKGAEMDCQGKFYSQPGFPVEVADVVGSGDAFLANYLSALHTGMSPEKRLASACAAGAIVASRPGAVPLVGWSDVETFINAGNGRFNIL